MRHILILLLWFVYTEPLPLSAQSLDELIQISWKHSSLLREKEFKLARLESQLKEAKALYMPSASIGSQYTLAAGGRSIDLPIGDLINPIHQKLNEIIGNPQFPNLQNVKTNFFPNNFYDAHLRIQQAIYQSDIGIAGSIKKEEIKIQESDIQASKRILAKEVTETCIQLASLEEHLKIIERAQQSLLMAKRNTESLQRNGLVTGTATLRIEAEIANLETKKTEITMNMDQSSLYLQYLTGLQRVDKIQFEHLPDIQNQAISPREEIVQLQSGIKIQEHVYKKEKQFYQPKIGVLADFGSQDFNFKWNPYVLIGLNLEWNFYNGGRLKQRKLQSEHAIHALESQLKAVQDQLDLQNELAKIQLNSKIAQAKNYEVRIASAEKIKTEAFKKYNEGSLGYLELLDAQNLWLNIQSDYQIARFNAWFSWADYQYKNASYPIQ
ncbi:MAG: TolC family protein [Saprospiraceae bacterium]|nr:TolC family protein [Saprospiraceae bacterium]